MSNVPPKKSEFKIKEKEKREDFSVFQNSVISIINRTFPHKVAPKVCVFVSGLRWSPVFVNIIAITLFKQTHYFLLILF